MQRARSALALLGALAIVACGPRYSDQYWSAYQAKLQLNGKLRTERAPTDAPFTASDLAQNFGKTAFGIDPEFHDDLDAEQLAQLRVIRRWSGPVRYAAYGSLSDQDGAALLDLTRRLDSIPGLDFAAAENPAAATWNMGIYFFDHNDREAFLGHLGREGDEGLLALFEGLFSDDLICSGTMLRRTGPDGELTGEIGHALVFIRAELPQVLRQSCIEEEIVQGMGLIRDDDAVRPSLFNEDEEFALMTTHDEYLLRILYDPRLRAGMTEEEAMPIVRRIAGELDLPKQF
ncbi:MAG: DUF2927 domain-containing protein [Pseudomonadota bacterium]